MLQQVFPQRRGCFAQDSGVRMQVIDFRCASRPARSIQPGDLVFEDIDGVLIVPADMIESVIAGALEGAPEKVVRREIEEGLSAPEAAFEKHHIF